MLILPLLVLLGGLDAFERYGQRNGPVHWSPLLLSSDQGFGETLEYAMTFAIAVMLLLMWRWRGARIYLVNALLFAFLTLDNCFQIHEAIGLRFSANIPGANEFKIPGRDLGELLFFGAYGGVWLKSIAATVSDRTHDRALAQVLILSAGVTGMVLFGVFVDVVSSLFKDDVYGYLISSWIEDSGELVFVTLTFLACVGIFDIERRRRRLPQ